MYKKFIIFIILFQFTLPVLSLEINIDNIYVNYWNSLGNIIPTGNWDDNYKLPNSRPKKQDPWQIAPPIIIPITLKNFNNSKLYIYTNHRQEAYMTSALTRITGDTLLNGLVNSSFVSSNNLDSTVAPLIARLSINAQEPIPNTNITWTWILDKQNNQTINEQNLLLSTNVASSNSMKYYVYIYSFWDKAKIFGEYKAGINFFLVNQ
jgi:hypothetical protein